MPEPTSPALGVRRLTLTNFRSYTACAIDFDGRPVALLGPNGAGKTNILEAISLFAPGRGLRSAAATDLPREGGDGGWSVAATLETELGPRALGVGLDPARGERRRLRVDGETVGRSSALADLLRISWLTPAMDRLFVEAAGDRRRFLDRLTLAHEPAHGAAASTYERAMRSRQKLLNEGGADAAWLAALERQMAETGVALAAARRDFAQRLQAEIDQQPDGPFPHADIAIEDEWGAALGTAGGAAQIEDALAEALAEMRHRDTAAKRALRGPHRADFTARHRLKNAPARLCSTGEQKALLVGIMLAHVRLLQKTLSRTVAVVLLDEVAAHL
ncbi:MAG: DNA replication/repair protein RecF, partial [Pseudomonadota bacterium]